MQLCSKSLREIYLVVVKILRCKDSAYWCVFKVRRLPVYAAYPCTPLTRVRRLPVRYVITLISLAL
jgi:hypothetical protein